MLQRDCEFLLDTRVFSCEAVLLLKLVHFSVVRSERVSSDRSTHAQEDHRKGRGGRCGHTLLLKR